HQRNLTGIVHPVLPYEPPNVLVSDWSFHLFLLEEVLTYLVITYQLFATMIIAISPKVQNTSWQ
ncbi:MAG: hypothetical protein KAT23_06225, partial [Anaerolineales bacterium]|nr:hypothetical protein [Anaerolineales bacterium]